MVLCECTDEGSGHHRLLRCHCESLEITLCKIRPWKQSSACNPRALAQQSPNNSPKSDERFGALSSMGAHMGTKSQSCAGRLGELAVADCAQPGKFAIPTADGTVLKLNSACEAARGNIAWAANVKAPARGSCGVSLLICQHKQTALKIVYFLFRRNHL